jgi:asparagine synthase (glutamine-hydrolysing)
MSGIYGIYRYDGAPVAADWLEQMRSAMAFYGPDGGGSKAEGPLGMGHLLLKITPEDAYEQQPVEGSRGPVVSAARLDNREELLALFHISPAAAASTADGHLVSMAFDRWGEELAVHLQGDWALAGWNRRERKLLLARDVFGTGNLYFHRGKGFIAFASSLKALLAIPGVTKQPDLLRIAQVVVGWQHDAELTAYAGFRRLVWAHSLSVGPEGHHRCWRYWSPEGRELFNYRRDEDYEEAFLEHYTRAVQVCLRTTGPVAATLSGGRDSGSVTAIAAPLLASYGRKLTAYTSIPCLPPDGALKARVGHEWDLAHATALMAGANVRHIAIDAAEYGVLQGIEQLLAIHDGPCHAGDHYYWIKAIVDKAVRDRAGVLLTGQMGNATVSWNGNGSVLLALLGRKPRVAWQLFLHAEPNLWFILKRQILKPVLTPALRSVRRLQSYPAPPWQAYSALNPRMASALELGARMRAAGYDSTFTPSPLKDRRLNFLKPLRGIGVGLWSEIGATHAISIQDPTSNLALLEFLLRVPDDQFRRDGQGSSLLLRTFRGRLPKPVLEGRRKGLQAADLGHRILRELSAIEQCLDALDAHPAARELLNIDLMRACLKSLVAKVDPETTGNTSKILLRGLGAAMFLRRFA